MNQHNPEYDYDLTQRSLPGVAASERAAFLTKTYTHLLLAIVAFIALEVVIFQLGWAAPIANLFLKGGQMGWLLVLGGFVLVGMVATRFAASAESRSAQYFGLGLYIVAEALIFVPLLFVAAYYADDPDIIGNSAIVTLVGFTALSMIVFITRKDFSFLRGLLMWGTIAAFGFILIAAFTGLDGGWIFPALMIGLAGAYILYETSNVLHHYPEDRYVGAALALFAAVALMFWYVLSLFLSRD